MKTNQDNITLPYLKDILEELIQLNKWNDIPL